ncbi:carbamoyltransferase HypF [Corynebacterium mendelii]|uniref:Carbamoyltransferase n=1 Tax=Corynebacterium mendelii TaxID=2765362 RepID=A0A939E1W2_9CORY|nr:carbamoyltransferase HypF [Corynebacterium mendelii]MBN9643992.1 carbamoyltransferase HypF [Corynebacterium mendelii]
MSVTRRAITVRGIVQGVGFRPHVARVAAATGVTGVVGNDDARVFIEAQGESGQLDEFTRRLVDEAPVLARIIDTTARQLTPVDGEAGFSIVASQTNPGGRSLIPPDVAVCRRCREEMDDPANRRFRYPFITCTDCGPRLSIITDLPYDRPRTTMRHFPMCRACRAEYTDPDNRRYHAQPVSCFDCGPTIWLEEFTSAKDQPDVDPFTAFLADQRQHPDDSNPDQAPAPVVRADRRLQCDGTIARAKQLLAAGNILAVKGIGGFHLLADAADDEAVARLRRRKNRPHKPLAVMVADLAQAETLVELGEQEKTLLTDPAHPIVIAPAAPGAPLSGLVNPGIDEIGVVIAYSPLHRLLVDRPVVATSGNAPGQPLVTGNRQAAAVFDGLADGVVYHDRPIEVPVEDSVFRKTLPIRRSRGFAPVPLALPVAPDSTPPTVLACGGELKNTVTLTDGDMAFISCHIGDMGSLAAQQAHQRAIDTLTAARRRHPDLIVCDMHPDYATTRAAERLADHTGVRLVKIQHHYAHAMSLAAEHGITSGPLVVLAADGTGYGTDGTVWGGEILTLGGSGDNGLAHWERSWHLPVFPLAGGDTAIRHPWRLAAGIAHRWDIDNGQVLDHLTAIDDAAQQLPVVRASLADPARSVDTSSLGRVIDAACALTAAALIAAGGAAATGRIIPGGIHQSFDAQAAMEYEQLAARAAAPTAQAADDCSVQQVFQALVDEVGLVARAVDPVQAAAVAARNFHHRISRVLARELLAAARRAGAPGNRQVPVGFTGGCAHNEILVADLEEHLHQLRPGTRLLTHTVVPAGDGGLSLGQAWAGMCGAADA